MTASQERFGLRIFSVRCNNMPFSSMSNQFYLCDIVMVHLYFGHSFPHVFKALIFVLSSFVAYVQLKFLKVSLVFIFLVFSWNIHMKNIRSTAEWLSLSFVEANSHNSKNTNNNYIFRVR